jgi:cytochrome c-type biogenesis protein CcmE
MKSKQLKFLVGSLVILAALAYFGYQGFVDSMSYSQTVEEMYASGDKAYARVIRVNGEVLAGSINRKGGEMTFVIGPKDFKAPPNFVPGPETQTLSVRFVGKDAIPDTFRDYASARIKGKLHRDGTFEGTEMTAQCASKYERESLAGVKETASKEQE